MENRKNEMKKTKQIAIDAELHRRLKTKCARENISIKECVEKFLKERFGNTPISLAYEK
jgi:predicted HicB family RNase H-like nuclease